MQQKFQDHQGGIAENSDVNSATGLEAKLPKLVIIKFNGTFQDWPRFWGQYSKAIDELSFASKFSCLRQLLAPKVRTSIEALRFSPEGYNRTKSILMDKYGKESEIIKAYNKEILDLPVIPGIDVKRIHEFSEQLSYCVHSLETMRKSNQVNRNVSTTLDKLPCIRGNLVRTNHSWESWNFLKLCKALRLWTRRNPLDSSENTNYVPRRWETFIKLFNAQQREPKQRGCVYCDDTSHVPLECPKISTVDERRQFLAQHRLCFNCACGSHEAPNCYSRSSCRTCKR